MKIMTQDKVAVVLNITLLEAEKLVLGLKVSDLKNAINLGRKSLTTTGQRQKFQPLCIIEIRETVQRFLLGII